MVLVLLPPPANVRWFPQKSICLSAPPPPPLTGEGKSSWHKWIFNPFVVFSAQKSLLVIIIAQDIEITPALACLLFSRGRNCLLSTVTQAVMRKSIKPFGEVQAE